jgi:hypothetical protein
LIAVSTTAGVRLAEMLLELLQDLLVRLDVVKVALAAVALLEVLVDVVLVAENQTWTDVQ